MSILKSHLSDPNFTNNCLENGTTTSKSPFIDHSEPVTLTWNNIEVKTSSRHLLKKVSGVALPGECIALMGASGAGKTTLLNTLLGRNSANLTVSGEILVNGINVDRGITNISSYVQQEDLFMGRLTVYEHLIIQSYMRLPSNNSCSQRKQRIKEIVDELELNDCLHSKIGSAGLKKGISGGQAKRLAFATELLTNPSLLFCDEPTTGLDSYMAAQVVRTLHRIACDTNTTIICTIHQPSSEIFESFDRIIFLALGEIAFQGPPSDAINFFQYLGFKFPNQSNPADLFIMYLAIEPGNEDESKNRINDICKKYNKSKYNDLVMKRIEWHKDNPHSTVNMPKPPSIFVITIAMIVRYFLDNLRNNSIVFVKPIQKFSVGLILGIFYFQTVHNQDGIANLKGLFYFVIAESIFPTTFMVNSAISKEYHLVSKEYHDGIYPIMSYYIARILAYILFPLIDGSIMCTIIYLLVGLKFDIVAIFSLYFILFMITFTSISFGSLISGIFIEYPVIQSMSTPILVSLSIFAGLFMNLTSLPNYISWLQHISWFKYGYESFIITQFNNLENIQCTIQKDGVLVDTEVCLRNGKEIIENMGFRSDNFSFNMFILFVIGITLFLLGYIAFTIRIIRGR
ncbi:ATP-binding cassette sub-family G member 2 [Strongyloides ratti]|uniref:ATP-binding cassette sub-family G member 2 n=1 Tax=Strongyloides ratti TaxID=34506 RepID=A0A090LDT5_STRRB|nr:ATP-binding cassette sub-family G member 2 [Strongyloides ratti]CEF66288.1 ATP-binding cassette sub-family G member 2 [Strongyloides ratti]